ncbi:uncharacterized protein UHOD_11105 [Ustilago sp. UG-2017b]|nr:uncharacterized protein UHOD_11105 [Ustilago sp. UG-2017b]
MTTSTDDSLDISAQLFWQSTTPTNSATQTKSVPALSQSGSTSAPDNHTSCPTQTSRSATGKKNFTWSGANCHGPECTGSKKAVGLYGRSIGVRDQADPQKSRPWQAMV